MSDVAQTVRMIAGDFYGGRLDLSARSIEPGDPWLRMPEVKVVREMQGHGVSNRTLRLFLTFVSAMDRARDANRLWRVAGDLFESCPKLFDPVEITRISHAELKRYLSASGVSQRHEPDSNAWWTIARSLVFTKSSPVCQVIDRGVGDAEELLAALRKEVDSEGKSRFPFLRGQKIGPMWVRIMANPGGAKIDRMEKIPVAVDVHVRRTVENLGITDTKNLKLEKAKPIIQRACREAVAKVDIGGPFGISGTSAALDPALWFYGKYGCSHCESVNKRIPISRACDHCQFGMRRV